MFKKYTYGILGCRTTVLLLFLLMMLCSQFTFAEPAERYIEIKDKHKVCMVNNVYNPMADFTPFKVTVEKKDYYGCCAGCRANLLENMKIRLARDPLTNEVVDKGTAYLVADKQENGTVLNFKEKDHFLRYVESKNH